jgi:hypothetical protein
VRKFRALHRLCKKRRRSPRGCIECGDTTHFITNCPKRKKLDSSSNKYDYTKWNDYSKGDNRKKYHFGDQKKKKFSKIISRACASLSNFDFSRVNPRHGDFTSLCLMGKSSRQIFDSDSNVSDDLSLDCLSLRVIELENAFASNTSCFVRFFMRTRS